MTTHSHRAWNDEGVHVTPTQRRPRRSISAGLDSERRDSAGLDSERRDSVQTGDCHKANLAGSIGERMAFTAVA